MATLSKRITGTKLQQHHERYINHSPRQAARTMACRFWEDNTRYPNILVVYVMNGRSELHNALFAIRNTCEND